MRYSAVCTSMLTDRVKDLESQREDAAKRVINLEVVTDKVLKKQDDLHARCKIGKLSVRAVPNLSSCRLSPSKLRSRAFELLQRVTT